MGDPTKWETDLKSNDDNLIKNTLSEIQKRTSPLEQEDTRKIIPLCIAQFQHHDLEVRASALEICVAQMKQSNWGMERLLNDLAKGISSAQMIDLKQGQSSGKMYLKFHMNIIYVANELQNRHPSKFISMFKPLSQYLISCLQSDDPELKKAAAIYWGENKIPPVPEGMMAQWVPTMYRKLNKFIGALLECMKYHDEHANYLEKQTIDETHPRTASKEYELYSDARNYSALAFEKVSAIFQNELIPVFRNFFVKWIKSSDWKENEAAILALGALGQAIGSSNDMKSFLLEIVPGLLEFYKHPKPLVRSICCFTLQNFVNVRLKNVKDMVGKILIGTLGLLQDNNIEVQDTALRSLTGILAYAEKDVRSHSKAIIDGVTKLQPFLRPDRKTLYYECIGHLCGRLGSSLSANELDQLVEPLLKAFSRHDFQSVDDAEEVVLLCQALCTVITYTKTSFAKHNDILVQKCMSFVSNVTATKGYPSQSEATNNYLVASLDLMSALFEGQGKHVKGIMGQHQVPKQLLSILDKDSLHDDIHQSALALMGHICTHSYDTIEDDIDNIVAIAISQAAKKSSGIKNNALWVTSLIAKTCTEKNDKLLLFSNDLVEMFTDLSGEEGVIINAAVTLTTLAVKWPNTLRRVVLKPENFMHLCILLQTEFSQQENKITIFKNVCEIVADNADKIKPESYVHFCVAAAMYSGDDTELTNTLKSVLKKVRKSIGNSGWNKVSNNIGKQMSVTLRKRYQLY